MRNLKGFTLLELIVTIIIIGVLTSLALPKLFSVIELSYAAEAMASIASIRSGMERCYLMANQDYDGCVIPDFTDDNDDWLILNIDNPGLSPNAHFMYAIEWNSGSVPVRYRIVATRRSKDGYREPAGGPGGCYADDPPPDCIRYEVNNTAGTITIQGFGKFKGLR